MRSVILVMGGAALLAACQTTQTSGAGSRAVAPVSGAVDRAASGATPAALLASRLCGGREGAGGAELNLVSQDPAHVDFWYWHDGSGSRGRLDQAEAAAADWCTQQNATATLVGVSVVCRAAPAQGGEGAYVVAAFDCLVDGQELGPARSTGTTAALN